jgi:hypothetical protein
MPSFVELADCAAVCSGAFITATPLDALSLYSFAHSCTAVTEINKSPGLVGANSEDAARSENLNASVDTRVKRL